MAVVRGDSENSNEPAVLGNSTAQSQGMGVVGRATRGSGVIGESVDWIGVYGESNNLEGVRGTSKNKNHAGVVGINKEGGEAIRGEGNSGLIGIGEGWVGVYGETQAEASVGAAGIWGDGKDESVGVKGHARAPEKAGVAGYHLTNSGPGIYGEGSPAGRFNGNVEVNGLLTVSGVGFATLLARLAVAEREIADLRQKIPGGGPSPSRPKISVTQTSGSKLSLNGQSFKPNGNVRIRIVIGDIGNELSLNTTIDSQGRFEYTHQVTGVAPGTTIWISATDGTPDSADFTGVLWSNTEMIRFNPHE